MRRPGAQGPGVRPQEHHYQLTPGGQGPTRPTAEPGGRRRDHRVTVCGGRALVARAGTWPRLGAPPALSEQPSPLPGRGGQTREGARVSSHALGWEPRCANLTPTLMSTTKGAPRQKAWPDQQSWGSRPLALIWLGARRRPRHPSWEDGGGALRWIRPPGDTSQRKRQAGFSGCRASGETYQTFLL